MNDGFEPACKGCEAEHGTLWCLDAGASQRYALTPANEMKAHIAASLIELVNEKPYAKITVGDISKKSNIARQTFYNHFTDKNDLVDWMYELLLQQTTRRIGVDLTWKEGTMRKLAVMRAHSAFFAQVYRETDPASLKSREPRKIISYYEANLLRLSGKRLDPLEASTLSIYCYGAVQLAAEWLGRGGKEPVSAIVAANEAALPRFAARILTS